MNVLITTRNPYLEACRVTPRPFQAHVSQAMRPPGALLAGLVHALRAWRRRESRAFRRAYEVLKHIDAPTLADIGLRSDQVTAFAQAASRACAEQVVPTVAARGDN